MDDEPVTNHVIRFGVFEANLETGELRKHGLRVRLGGQPFQVLARLLNSPGTLVTREELKDELWPDDTFVDFENGVNGAIRRIRRALDDSADAPRYVETLPRRGYRFVGQVEGRPLDSAFEAQSAASDGRPLLAASRPHSETITRRRQYFPRFLLSAIGLALLLVLALYLRHQPTQPPLRKFAITTPTAFSGRNLALVAISPDGKRVAFAEGTAEGKLWVQDLDDLEPGTIAHTEGASWLFWSPDSKFIGFATSSELKRVAVEGGQIIRLCALPGTNYFDNSSGSWSPDGETIVFDYGGVIYKVPALGGTPEPLIGKQTETASAKGRREHVGSPHFLPSQAGRVLVFALGGSSPVPNLMLQDLDSGRQEPLAEGTRPFYSPTGHVVYQRQMRSHDLMALPFSLETLKVTGEAFPIAHDGYNPSVAADGTLVYLERPADRKQLVWLNRSGEKIGDIGPVHRDTRDPALSPDGRRVALSVGTEAGQHVWVYDLAQLKGSPVTIAGEKNFSAVWEPSGEHVAFSANRIGNFDILLRRADGTGEEQIVIDTPVNEILSFWSREGRFLLFERRDPETGWDIWCLDRKEDGSGWGEPRPFLQIPSSEREPKLSPDGHHIAYVSDLSGQPEVYVESFPEGGGRKTISTNGGTQPRWRRDGKEMFYLEGDALMAVQISTSPSFSEGLATPLFRHSTLEDHTAHPQYDVSDDGQRFILAEPAGDRPKPRIRVVQNWFAEFQDGGND